MTFFDIGICASCIRHLVCISDLAFLHYVALCLSREKLIVLSALCHERAMIALFCNLAVFDHDYLRGYGRARQPVGYEYCRLAASQLLKLIEDLLLRHRIEGCGRLVEDQKIRIGVERTCNRQLLPLTDRKLRSVFVKIAHERGFVTERKRFYELVRARLNGGGFDLIVVLLL